MVVKMVHGLGGLKMVLNNQKEIILKMNKMVLGFTFLQMDQLLKKLLFQEGKRMVDLQSG